MFWTTYLVNGCRRIYPNCARLFYITCMTFHCTWENEIRLLLQISISNYCCVSVLFVSLEAAVMKLDPEDGEQIIEYFKTHALLTREKARKTEEQSLFVYYSVIHQPNDRVHRQLWSHVIINEVDNFVNEGLIINWRLRYQEVMNPLWVW